MLEIRLQGVLKDISRHNTTPIVLSIGTFHSHLKKNNDIFQKFKASDFE